MSHNTAWLERVPSERVADRARDVRAGETFIRLVVGLFFVTGWVAAKILGSIWFALVFCALATQEGWRAGRAGSQRRE